MNHLIIISLIISSLFTRFYLISHFIMTFGILFLFHFHIFHSHIYFQSLSSHQHFMYSFYLLFDELLYFFESNYQFVQSLLSYFSYMSLFLYHFYYFYSTQTESNYLMKELAKLYLFPFLSFPNHLQSQFQHKVSLSHIQSFNRFNLLQHCFNCFFFGLQNLYIYNRSNSQQL